MSEIESLVSVIMPAFNCEKTIAKSIHSVLEQSYDNFEIIIYNLTLLSIYLINIVLMRSQYHYLNFGIDTYYQN